ncbi:MAG: precorrin-2 C(20)-methyltransferase [Planctomycetes bacterium]|nr:precorrin-2 C(20)-methyltransferase [Planctomycetota bacterium]
MNIEKAAPGNFYAVGVGPGSPDLLTIRALRLIESADIIVAPRSELSKESLAVKSVEPYLSNQEVVEHVYPMSRDQEGTNECWREIAERVNGWCGEGKSVVQITIGDPSVYSTSSYLLFALTEMMEEERIHVVPGITAFQAAAARFHECLSLQDDRMVLLPAGNMDAVADALDNHETVIIYKAGKHLAKLRELLSQKGLLEQARLACYVEQEGKERLWKNFGEVDLDEAGYMATVLVRTGWRKWSEK